jgi:hypothetical protein
VVGVRLVIEGGGAGSEADAELRRNMSAFLKTVLPNSNSPRIVAAGSRGDAYKTFLLVVKDNPNHFVMLVVDSEDEVSHKHNVWQHLQHRDNWPKPEGADDEQAHLMVRSMECWFLADKEAVAAYFGKDFNANALPPNPKIEEIHRHAAADGLDKAAKLTSKKGYHKSRDGFKLIGVIDGKKVCAVSCHATEFFRVLKKKL